MKKAAEKAGRVGSRLARLMPNIGGPREDRRRLLSSVVHSVLLYGAPTWAHTLDLVPGSVKVINKTQRQVLLRCICAYRTFSEAATNAIASTPPADLLAREREEQFLNRRAGQVGPCSSELRKRTIIKWQERWDEGNTWRWTRRLIPDLTSWCIRGFGKVDFHLTQLLSGHGCFGEYLHRFKKLDDPKCVNCQEPVDDAEHALFGCGRWWSQKRELEYKLGCGELTPETLMETMLKSRGNWLAIAEFTDLILSTREEEERDR